MKTALNAKYVKYKDEIEVLWRSGVGSDTIARILSEKYKDPHLARAGRQIRRRIEHWFKNDDREELKQKKLTNQAKVLLFDLETAPLIAYTWSIWNVNIGTDFIIRDWFVYCWSAKWLFDDKIISMSLTNNEIKDANDKRIIQGLWNLFDEADIIIAHNLDKFDEKRSKTRFLKYGLGLPSPYSKVDTLKVAKRNFNITSNRMDYIAKKFLGIDGKMETPKGLWQAVDRCEEGAMETMVAYCITPDHKLLKDDLRWYEANDINVGDNILGFDEHSNGRSDTRIFRNSEVLYKEYDTQEVFEVILSSGKVFKVTKEHKWLTRCGKSYKWKRTDELIIPNGTKTRISKVIDVWDEIDTKDAGWLAGMFDGEGCLSFRGAKLKNGKKPITNLSISQRPTKVLDRIEDTLKKFSNLYGKRITKNNSDCITLSVRGFKYQKLHFLGSIRPERLVEKVDFDALGQFESRAGDEYVESVRSIGLMEIVKIKTSTGTFICDGYAHHNCEQDIRVLEDVYMYVRPYHRQHPNIGLIEEDAGTVMCKTCGSENVKECGEHRTMVAAYTAYRCDDCKSISYGRTTQVDKEHRKNLLK